MFGCEYITKNVPAKYHPDYPSRENNFGVDQRRIIAGRQIPEFFTDDDWMIMRVEPFEIGEGVDAYPLIKSGEVLMAGWYNGMPPVIEEHHIYFFTETEESLNRVLDHIGDPSKMDENFRGEDSKLRKFQMSDKFWTQVLTMMYLGDPKSITPNIRTTEDLYSYSQKLNPTFPKDTVAWTEDVPFYFNECAMWPILQRTWNEHINKWPIL